jgi:uncharacterized delta-60 repeat protein
MKKKITTLGLLILIAAVTTFQACGGDGGGGAETPNQVATPQFSPTEGTYSSDQNVTISTSTEGSTIYYTTDGSTPTTASIMYTTPISVEDNGVVMTIKAIAVKSGMEDSTLASATFTIDYDQVSTPQFNPVAGTYNSDQDIEITTSTSDATIYYTTDGNTPTTSSTLYTAPIPVEGNGTVMTIQAIAVKIGMEDSELASATFTIDYDQVSTPQFNPVAGTYNSDQNVTITTSTSGAAIYYTTDGGTPTTSSTLYTEPIPVEGNETVMTIQAIAVKSGMEDSTVSSASYEIHYPDPGTLDTSFGTGGIVTTAINGTFNVARAIAIEVNGKIVVAGTSSMYFALARYNSDGTLDTTFDTDGKVTTDFGSGGASGAYAIAIDANGKIVVAGYVDIDNTSNINYDFALARYNSDGSLDTSFGTGGKVITAIGSGYDQAYSMVIDANGKIIVAGSSRNSSNVDDFALIRYNSDGSLDTSFGTGGKVTTPIGSGYDQAYSIAIDANGRIVAAGYSDQGGSPYYDFALIRYNSDGSLDTTFGTGGIVTTPIGSGYDVARTITIDANGKIIITGETYNGSNHDFALARYNSDGSLDTDFGTGGKVITAIGSGDDKAYSVGIDANGRIIVAGSSSNGSNHDFALARYNTNGSLDTDFGTSGKVITAIGSVDDRAYSMAIDANGRIVLAGYSNSHVDNNSNPYFALARYWP